MARLANERRAPQRSARAQWGSAAAAILRPNLNGPPDGFGRSVPFVGFALEAGAFSQTILASPEGPVKDAGGEPLAAAVANAKSVEPVVGHEKIDGLPILLSDKTFAGWSSRQTLVIAARPYSFFKWRCCATERRTGWNGK
jgi:hypothetical protein